MTKSSENYLDPIFFQFIKFFFQSDNRVKMAAAADVVGNSQFNELNAAI